MEPPGRLTPESREEVVREPAGEAIEVGEVDAVE
jgi:hypothetical protein